MPADSANQPPSLPHLLTAQGRQLWREPFQRAARVLIATDFDGTLAPIVAQPDQARALPQSRAALQRLAKLPGVSVAVVSGRSLVDLVRMCPLDRAWYLGGHGSEVQPPMGSGVPQAWGEMPATAAEISVLAQRIRQQVAGWPEIFVEEKPWSVAVHYRRRPELEPQVQALAREAAQGAPVRLLEGKCLVELMHRSYYNKGTALQQLINELQCDWAMFLGDDTTDEDVFALRDPRILGVFVGNPQTRSTAAQCWVLNPREVGALLLELLGVPRPELSAAR